jgi:hypothetical protein
VKVFSFKVQDLKIPAALLLIILFLAGCTSSQPTNEAVPLVTIEQLLTYGDMVRLAAPMAVRDSMYTQASYNAQGELVFLELDRELFPADVIVHLTEDMTEPLVFLARAPHSRCILNWNAEEGRLEDPCFGSTYSPEGKYLFGPSPRDLDIIPSKVENGLLWVEPTIIYGETHP